MTLPARAEWPHGASVRHPLRKAKQKPVGRVLIRASYRRRWERDCWRGISGEDCESMSVSGSQSSLGFQQFVPAQYGLSLQQLQKGLHLGFHGTVHNGLITK